MNTATDLNKLRIACAEIVGWKPITAKEADIIFKESGYNRLGYYQNPDPEKSWDRRQPYNLPDYPTDPTAALSLVDWMAERGWETEISLSDNKLWDCEMRLYRDGGCKAHFHQNCPSFCLAVVGAFLKCHPKFQDENSSI